jgi:acyl-coenzyme A synthetase/AMP-(fatty) acid ligase
MTVGRSVPLTAHGPAGIIAHRPEGPVTVTQFLADVRQLVALLPAGGSILNVCEDRYRFMVGFAAAVLAGKVSLLPASHTPETVRQLQAYAADLFCLHDGKGAEIDLPRLEYPRQPAVADVTATLTEIHEIPDIPEDRVAVCLFTSGSTGVPVAQRKTWGALVRNGRAEAERLGVDIGGYAIVGTVPAQHSYGFESTVLLSLQGQCAAWAGRPFYPADIAAALAAVPRPRLLVTTPLHLRALLDADVAVPPLDMLLSATAPLADALALESEARLGAPLYEIYGCTEAGQLATRRTSAGPGWTLFPGVRFEQEAGTTIASGGHVEGRVPLSDVLEVKDDGTFLLHGRHADMVNIAGKRTSLAYLNHQLNAIEAVEDGCFFMPDETASEGVTRLCAFVVAPTLQPRQVLAALRERIDAIFLPRPLLMVEQLPRNATGKLPRRELQALLERHQRSTM